jgi:hypothetical protein
VKALGILTFSMMLLAMPAVASDTTTSEHDLAEKRLRGCLAAGAASAPKTDLASALQSTRAFCGPQIADLAAIRTREASRGLSGEPADEARKQALRELNNEIAYAVANFTGLTQ